MREIFSDSLISIFLSFRVVRLVFKGRQKELEAYIEFVEGYQEFLSRQNGEGSSEAQPATDPQIGQGKALSLTTSRT